MSTIIEIKEPLFFFPGTDQFLVWGPLCTGSTSDADSPTLVTDATGTATIYDRYDNAIPGATGIVFAPKTNGSDGIYQAPISGADFNPREGRSYYGIIEINSSALGAVTKWRFKAWIDSDGPR